eukprot:5765567-Pyramimonas_sp.AAC.1
MQCFVGLGPYGMTELLIRINLAAIYVQKFHYVDAVSVSPGNLCTHGASQWKFHICPHPDGPVSEWPAVA